MRVEDAAFELIALTYDAVLEPEKWPVFMERLVKVMGARSALLREVDYKAEKVGIFETVGYDPAYVAAFRKYYVHLDYLTPAMVKVPVGDILTGDEVMPIAQQRKAEYFNDYQFAQGIRYTMGITLARDERSHLMFAMQRETGQGNYSEGDRRLVRLLAPHIVRANQIHQQMAEVTSQKHWALSALDHLRVGVILLDSQGRPVHINHAAERLGASRNGFVVGRHGLELRSPTETAKLRRLIAEAAMYATGQGNAAAGSLCVRAAGSSAVEMQLQVIPLLRDVSDRHFGQYLRGTCVAVFVSIPGGPRLSWSRVAAMHGLTRAEARLATKLAEGISLDDAADTLLVSIQTVRSQLKSVFSKTGVTRQAELVALLLGDVLIDPADNQT